MKGSVLLLSAQPKTLGSICGSGVYFPSGPLFPLSYASFYT